jgi:hypothetical protein
MGAKRKQMITQSMLHAKRGNELSRQRTPSRKLKAQAKTPSDQSGGGNRKREASGLISRNKQQYLSQKNHTHGLPENSLNERILLKRSKNPLPSESRA